MTILLFFIETKIGRTIAITGAIIVGVLVGWLAFKTHYYNQGWKAAIFAIAAQDQGAVDEKNKALEATHACRNSGGTWDVPNRVCNQ